MRPEGRGEYDSLYFSYPHFAARRAPELDGATDRHPVLIVGAGPIGMTAALTLARYGIASVVLEQKATFNDGSRAICVARPSCQILEQIGAIAPFLDKALGWTSGRSYYRDQEIYRFRMAHPPGEKYLPMYNLQQQYLEQYLWEACDRSPLIDIRWQSEVTGIDNGDDGVVLNVASPEGSYSIGARYVLAADGARSAVRSLMGLRLRGQNYEGRYVIADVRMAHDFPTERRAFFHSAGNPDGTVLIHKQPDDIWRIDYQLREGETPEEAIREGAIRARVGAILKDIGHAGPWELEWWSIYTANTLCLDDYRHKNVIFIGDSAHIVPIFGVRGLNNGVADAFNVGWKLGYVLNGHAPDALIDSYTPERRGATLDVFANATKSTRFMTPPTRGWGLVREAVLSLAIRHPFAQTFADPRQMQPYTYADSPLTTQDGSADAGTRAGAAAPNAKLSDGSFLLDHAGTGFTALIFVDEATSAARKDLLAEMARLDPQLTVLLIGAGATDPTLRDQAGTIAATYAASAGAIVLLRPDLHIAGQWQSPGQAPLYALKKALGHGGGHA